MKDRPSIRIFKQPCSFLENQNSKAKGEKLYHELLRVLKRMLKWKPGLQNGAPIDSKLSQPITFYPEADTLKVAL